MAGLLEPSESSGEARDAMFRQLAYRVSTISRHIASSTASESASTASLAQPAPVLDPTTWKLFPLIDKRQYNHNTVVFKFGLPREDDVLGLPVGSHFYIRASIEGKPVLRPYTPISSAETRGHFELLVKIYEKGKMTQYLNHLAVGQSVELKEPLSRFAYRPNMPRTF